jgi:EF-P beta-lysylation protein EpmB
VIPQTEISDQASHWQTQLREVITTIDALCATLGLRADDLGFSAAASRDFALKVPLAFAQRMRPADPRDPLLLQVLASQQEMISTPGFGKDPVGETGAANPQPGIIHKYQGRVLLVTASGCAINCRYCFRRHFPYGENRNSREQWGEAIDYIAARSDITEVILSGGDPLIAGDRQLQELIEQLGAIDHVVRLRIHSRLPVVIPARVTQGLLDAITQPGLQTVLVIHSNHANEIDDSVATAMAALRQRGISVLNQAVLLAGVNDSTEALTALSESLFAAGVLPYYLHLLDPVAGAAHFDVDESRAKQLMREVTARLPGYLVPKLVREIAGADAKVGIPIHN